MKIIDKLNAKQNAFANAPVTIGFIGDSVTQGCFECYMTGETSLEPVYDVASSYSSHVKTYLNFLYPNVQINIVNAGISGDNIVNGLSRMDRDLLQYKPDLAVISFGLNDSGRGLDGLKPYGEALQQMIDKLKVNGSEVVFLTENFMDTQVSPHLTDEFMRNLAVGFAEIQSKGILKQYFDLAKNICNKNGVPVCDSYDIWQKMFDGGVNTTELLSNKLNHPVREWHKYLAIKLIETFYN